MTGRRRLARPLNQEALQAARGADSDQEFRARYLSHGGAEESAAPDDQLVDSATQPCREADLIVHVTTLASNPIKDAQVQIIGPETRNQATDTEGYARFHTITPGEYAVIATAGPNSDTETVYAAPCQSTLVELSLCPHPDEVRPIAQYILDEMRVNAASQETQRMRELNTYSLVECLEEKSKRPWLQQLLVPSTDLCPMEPTMRASALLSWTVQVRQDGPWDHKPIIRRRFNPRVPGGEQAWHKLGDTPNANVYFYDIWSNIHYGYVGRAAGFSESALLDGAGLEQIATDILRLRRPSEDQNVSGLRAYDDASDRESIALGIQLYPNLPTVNKLLQLIEATPGLTRQVHDCQ